MRIGELCKTAGVSKEFVRYYEKLGLIASYKVPAGTREYRHFPADTLHRLRLIKKGKSIGLTLKQIRPLLDAYLNHDLAKQRALQLLEEQWQQAQLIIEQQQHKQAFIRQLMEIAEGAETDTGGTLKVLDNQSYTL